MGRRFVASLVLGLGGALAVTGCGPAGPAAIPTTAGNTWQEMRNSPLSPRSGAVGVWTGREVLLIGGPNGELCPSNALCLRDGTPLADGAALDPRTGRWRRIADAPVPLGGAAAVVVGQTAYLMPYMRDTGAEATALAYEVDQDRWHWLPVPFGGGAYPDGGRLDPVTGRWSSLPDLPDGSEYVAGAFTDSTAVYFGVRGAVLDTTADRRLRLPATPDDRGSHTVVAAGTDLVAFGGVDWTSGTRAELSNSTWIWSPPTTA